MINNSNVLIEIKPKELANERKYKSTMVIGNIIVNNIKHFNWLQKLMFKIFFGIKIEDIRKDKE